MTLILPAYTEDMLTATEDAHGLTITAPRWFYCIADLIGTDQITCPDDLIEIVTVRVPTPLVDDAKQCIAEGRRILTQPPPRSLPRPGAIAALTALLTGPRTITTREEWRALPYPNSGLCLKVLDYTPASWGFAVLTDLGRQTVAANLALAA